MRKLLAILLFAGACTGSAYIVDDGPPVARAEVTTYRPGYVWVHGHWTNTGRRWVWQNGYYARERQGYVYVEGGWHRRGNRHVYRDGVWRRNGG